MGFGSRGGFSPPPAVACKVSLTLKTVPRAGKTPPLTLTLTLVRTIT